MSFPDVADDPEDTRQRANDRACAASRSTSVSVAVNLALTVVQIAVGVFSKSQGLITDGIHSPSDLVSNAWPARSDAASSLVVGLGIIGNPMTPVDPWECPGLDHTTAAVAPPP